MILSVMQNSSYCYVKMFSKPISVCGFLVMVMAFPPRAYLKTDVIQA